MKLSVSWNGDGGANAAWRSFRPLKRTVFISYGENARRIGRTRRLPALSGALRAERTPQFARSFRFLQNVGKMYRLVGGWRSQLRTTLRTNSLISREKAGNSAFSAPRMSLGRRKMQGQQVFFQQIPYSTKQGILLTDQGIKSADHGIPITIRESVPGVFGQSLMGGRRSV
jgi:hypothetical protein